MYNLKIRRSLFGAFGLTCVLAGCTSAAPQKNGSEVSSKAESREPDKIVTAVQTESKKKQVYQLYLKKVREAVDSKWVYPPLAAKHGLRGTVFLEFRISPNGQLAKTTILRSSGSSLLDDESVRAVTAAAPFPPTPPIPLEFQKNGVKDAQDLKVTVTFNYDR
jgi:TonB family protein